MDIAIDNNSSIPVYQQLIHSLETLIETGHYKAGDILPSMNCVSESLGISKETAKKAYNILRDKGYIEPAQGKGFFVKSIDEVKSTRILMLFDKLSTYKLVLYRSFVESVGKNIDITIHLHNQDIELFDSLLESNLDKYDYYIITPHFPTDERTQANSLKLLRKIPNRKLIVLDTYLPDLTGNFGSVYQDFQTDIYDGLTQGIELLKRFDRINVVTTPTSLYAKPLSKGLSRFFSQHNFEHSTSREFKKDDLQKGTVYLILGSQLDSELFGVLRAAKENGFVIGKDIGVVSYNESPINEFIVNGLTTLSTDFAQMGRIAAQMVNTGQLHKVHNQFNLIVRNTL